MKKQWLFALILTLAVGISCAASAASEYRPYRELPRMQLRDTSKYFDGPSEAETGIEYSWTVKGAPDEAVNFAFSVALDDRAETGSRYLSTIWQGDQQASSTLTYTFMIPGTYNLYVEYYDASGEIIRKDGGSSSDWVTVTAGQSQPVQEKVNEVLAECRAAGVTGDFDTALWLHDWLTHHAYYDYNYNYYGPDGVLLHNTGVCDSYARAYQMLLTAAGIEAVRQSGTGHGGNHAWNTVKLGGVWTHVDVTWDDPGRSTELVSGSERYTYFGLTDELLAIDHGWSGGKECSSLEQNYYVVQGEGDMGYRILPLIQEQLDAMETALSVQTNKQYVIAHSATSITFSTDSDGIVLSVYAYILSQKEWETHGLAASAAFAYDRDTGLMSAAVTLLPEGKLEMPADLTEIREEAFLDNPAQEVVIPENCAVIGSRAFAGSGVKLLTLPLNADIATDAFDQTDVALVTLPQGGTSEAFAQSQGWIVRYTE